ncbi:3916_t:CDS:2, partial [Dentiscutata erythropus]
LFGLEASSFGFSGGYFLGVYNALFAFACSLELAFLVLSGLDFWVASFVLFGIELPGLDFQVASLVLFGIELPSLDF